MAPVVDFPPLLARASRRASDVGSATSGPSRTVNVLTALSMVLVAILFVLLPHGEMAPSGQMVVDPVTGERVFVHEENHALRTAGAVLGQISGLMLLVSLATTRLRMPRLHRRLGVLMLMLGAGHALPLLLNGDLRGYLPGFASLALLVGHGLTGALRARLLLRWGAGWWRYAHRASAWGALLFALEHVLLASWHFGLARHFAHG